MDAIRKPYRAPEIASEGRIESLTHAIFPPPMSDTSHTGRAGAEGSVGFTL
jgi:hypothetical protein